MIEEKDTYTRIEVKQILAILIDSIGHDVGSICHWNGVDSITVDEWRNATFKAMNEFHEYGKRLAYYNMMRIAEERTKKND
jgi:hypothetical protein